jgi:hypothetical protein
MATSQAVQCFGEQTIGLLITRELSIYSHRGDLGSRLRKDPARQGRIPFVIGQWHSVLVNHSASELQFMRNLSLDQSELTDRLHAASPYYVRHPRGYVISYFRTLRNQRLI